MNTNKIILFALALFMCLSAMSASRSISIITIDGKKSVEIEVGGEVVRTFRSVHDFSESDKQEYSYAYSVFVVEESKGKSVKEAVETLHCYDENGYKIYHELRDKAPFELFLGPHNDIPTAVHEALHALDNQISKKSKKSSYYLVNGETLSFKKFSTPYRSIIYKELLTEEEREDVFAKTYLTGSGGEQGLHVLLDELNAYAHDVNTTIQLAEGRDHRMQASTGLVKMTYFTLIYLEHQKLKRTRTWRKMSRRGDFKKVVNRLFEQAFAVHDRAQESSHVGLSTYAMLMDMDGLKNRFLALGL